ncbi:MAG: WxcM-like domain-containing protein [Muribaculaceae bacterium]|nr:WxcM-like domain-containing protein [Muribaculaceae bacterium]
MNTLDDCRLIDLAKHKAGRRGNLTAVQGSLDIPFDISRVYYIYDVPGGESRGSHAHRELYQLLVAVSGSFDVLLDDGVNKKSVCLSKPTQALLLPPEIWHQLDDFSSGTVALSLTSAPYAEQDYIRDYDEFIKFREENL